MNLERNTQKDFKNASGGVIWNHIFGHCKQDECFWLYELSVPVHKDCILTYLNIVVVIIGIEISAIYFIFIASICIFENKNGQRY